jgi:hypothetical protein
VGDPIVLAVGPHQIIRISDTLVTVRYPPDATTVLSMQPDGRVETRPEGACGPYELALLGADRLVYAPKGAAGAVYLIPYAPELPVE